MLISGTLISMSVLLLAGCVSDRTAVQLPTPAALGPAWRAAPGEALFSVPAPAPDVSVLPAPDLPAPRPPTPTRMRPATQAVHPVGEAQPGASTWTIPGGVVCVDGVCTIPPPAADPDPFASVPRDIERPHGLLVPSGGSADLKQTQRGAIFGRAWERDRTLRGIGIGLRVPVRRTWHVSGEIGAEPQVGARAGGVVVAAGLSRRF